LVAAVGAQERLSHARQASHLMRDGYRFG